MRALPAFFFTAFFFEDFLEAFFAAFFAAFFFAMIKTLLQGKNHGGPSLTAGGRTGQHHQLYEPGVSG